jgi:NAD(P)-dependent dehydrogenase (short-subunit alcohol dehydrogenase family)
MSNKDLKDRIIVVTGASRGIGYHTALAAAAAGAHVIAIARTIGALEELDDQIRGIGERATLVPFDLTDFDAIDRLGAALYERWGRVDGLIGNAGELGAITPLGHMNVKEWDKIFAVNVTANWRLIRSLDPLLKKSDAGRSVFLSSNAAHSCKPYWGAYSASKAALEVLARTYANENMETNITCNLVNPGAMRTAMRAKAMPGEDPETLPHPSEIAPTLVHLMMPEILETGMLFDFPRGDWIELGN